MARVEPRVLRGFRDYLPQEMIPRRRMLAVIERSFQKFGYLPLQTPALEYLDILMGKYGEEGSKLLYKFRDEGDRQVALRYDLTVPLARVMAQHRELPQPFRRYQIAPVWRAEKPARGRFREFVQCDGDLIGSSDPLADAEIIQLGCVLLDDLGVERYRVRLNHRKILFGLEGTCGIPRDKSVPVLRTIDKLPKIGPKETRLLLTVDQGLAPEQVDRIFEFLEISGENAEVLSRLEQFFSHEGPGREGVVELGEVLRLLESAGLGSQITLDLTIARGLDYYTGTVYETFLEDLPGFGAVMSGGRYDGLIGTFAGQEIPAVGISLGIDRLTAGLKELKILSPGEGPLAHILVTVFNPRCAPAAMEVAANLRAAGIDCELFPSFSKLSKQFKYAERRGMRWVVVVGPEEVEHGQVQVKDMECGMQEPVQKDRISEYLKAKVEGK